MKAEIQNRKDGNVTLELEDGQSLTLPESSVRIDEDTKEVFVMAVSTSAAKQNAEIGQAMINELLS